jgi:hypothetical protein
MSAGNYENLGEYAVAKYHEWLKTMGYAPDVKSLPWDVIDKFQHSDEFKAIMAEDAYPQEKIAVALTFHALEWLKSYAEELKHETATFHTALLVDAMVARLERAREKRNAERN